MLITSLIVSFVSISTVVGVVVYYYFKTQNLSTEIANLRSQFDAISSRLSDIIVHSELETVLKEFAKQQEGAMAVFLQTQHEVNQSHKSQLESLSKTVNAMNRFEDVDYTMASAGPIFPPASQQN